MRSVCSLRADYEAAVAGIKKHLVREAGRDRLVFVGELEDGTTDQLTARMVCEHCGYNLLIQYTRVFQTW